uniref:Uncharacterized protein n=1 Tax=Myoviridae sp. ctu3o5 TaxID=2825198 RepID=A0A8S5U1M3_9CAUD|nr:MAG TPA: hypothetical protein [Myoviridae sp. ctu3o5]
MKQYKLLKDLPGLKKGTILSEGKSLFGARTLITKNDVGPIFIGNDLTEELFEEIKEPVDSIHWKPKIGDRCFVLENTNIRPTAYTGMLRDYNAWRTGRVFRTEEECEKARDRELAEVRLQRTSDFKPDFENGEGGWTVFFSYMHKELHPIRESYSDSGEPVRYATEEEAKKSIKENREDWLIYFGIDPSDTNES